MSGDVFVTIVRVWHLGDRNQELLNILWCSEQHPPLRPPRSTLQRKIRAEGQQWRV